jgi:hypothetical protein
MRLFRLDGRELMADYVGRLAARLATARAAERPAIVKPVNFGPPGRGEPILPQAFQGLTSTIGRGRPRADTRNIDSSAGPSAQ